jgi:quinol monooxygenase YgiN
LPLHVFVRFEPRLGKRNQLFDELMLILDPTRAESGCIQIHLYESTRDPVAFFIHSEWTDEEAFDAHSKLPHMMRFLGIVDELITHSLRAVRTKQLG